MNSFSHILGLLLDVPVRARDALRERWPTDRRLRALAASPRAEAARARELARIHRLVEALGAVEGVEHLVTRVSDHCDRPSGFSSSSTVPRRALLVCRMSASAHFATREDIRTLLPRIEAARLAAWDASPGSTGTVGYALRWYREGGRDPQGRRMPSPGLLSADAYLSWDLPATLCPDPYWKRTGSRVHLRNTQTPPHPDAATLLHRARTDGHALVLELELRTGWLEHCTYHAVPRGGLTGRGRERKRAREREREQKR